MSDNKLVKTLTDAATLTGLSAGYGWIAKKVIKEPMTSDPSSNLMKYVKLTDTVAASIARKSILKTNRFCRVKKMLSDCTIGALGFAAFCVCVIWHSLT